jgi:hypothetical protein
MERPPACGILFKDRYGRSVVAVVKNPTMDKPIGRVSQPKSGMVHLE